jgi:hypothetical protein
MKTFQLIVISAALSSAALTYAGERAPKSPAAKVEAVTSIPKGATEVEPFLFRFKDPGGKVWMYRQTPFGVTKWEEGKQPVQPVVETINPIRVQDLGDTVRFERSTPFGPAQWERKKSDLTEEEKGLLKSHQDAQNKPTEKH